MGDPAIERGRLQAERFFRATAYTGELHLRDFHDWEDWNLERLEFRDETEVSWLMRTGAGERRVVRTAAELDATLKETTAAAASTSTSASALSKTPSDAGKR